MLHCPPPYRQIQLFIMQHRVALLLQFPVDVHVQLLRTFPLRLTRAMVPIIRSASIRIESLFPFTSFLCCLLFEFLLISILVNFGMHSCESLQVLKQKDCVVTLLRRNLWVGIYNTAPSALCGESRTADLDQSSPTSHRDNQTRSEKRCDCTSSASTSPYNGGSRSSSASTSPHNGGSSYSPLNSWIESRTPSMMFFLPFAVPMPAQWWASAWASASLTIFTFESTHNTYQPLIEFRKSFQQAYSNGCSRRRNDLSVRELN